MDFCDLEAFADDEGLDDFCSGRLAVGGHFAEEEIEDIVVEEDVCDGLPVGASGSVVLSPAVRSLYSEEDHVVPVEGCRSRAWVGTLNNYTLQEYSVLVDFAKNRCTYSIIGKEVGDNGTPHLQFYLYATNKLRFSVLKKLFPRAHWEEARGDGPQNKDYCSKDGNFVEFGICPMSKKQVGIKEKERWSKAIELCKKGDLDSVDGDIFFRFYRTCKEIKKDYMTMPVDSPDVTGIWYYGAAGTGKSMTARKKYPGSYMKMCNKWFDGYQGQDTVLIDDFDKTHSKLGHHLKIWGDRYSFLAESKGSAICIRPKTIIVTSQYSIDEIWEDQATREAIKRRFKCTHFSSLAATMEQNFLGLQ